MKKLFQFDVYKGINFHDFEHMGYILNSLPDRVKRNLIRRVFDRKPLNLQYSNTKAALKKKDITDLANLFKPNNQEINFKAEDLKMIINNIIYYV